MGVKGEKLAVEDAGLAVETAELAFSGVGGVGSGRWHEGRPRVG